MTPARIHNFLSFSISVANGIQIGLEDKVIARTREKQMPDFPVINEHERKFQIFSD